MKESFVITPMQAKEPLIGIWLAYLEERRSRTKETINTLTREQLDKHRHKNSIGSLLYHIALIEADWLYAEILQEDYPKVFSEWFPWNDRDQDGNLMNVTSWEVGQYLELLDKVCNLLIKTLSEMSLADFHRIRSLAHYDVTPEWVCLHLLQHEANHLGQIKLFLSSQTT
jgi:uncharacterized damage-inducible protein DinB